MTPKLKAVLLNVFVLPGLGQIIIGRKITGFICIMAINMILLAALFLLLKTLSPLISAQLAGGIPLSVPKIAETVTASTYFGKAILFSFATVWLFALVDILKNSDNDVDD